MKTYLRQLWYRALCFEGALVGVAIIWGLLREIPWWHALTPRLSVCLGGILAGGSLFTLNYLSIEYGSRYSAGLRSLKQLIDKDVSPLFQRLPLVMVAMIALVSGVAEEVFFRGVLQAEIGLWLASLIFGLAHIWRKTAILYGSYAAIIGVLFGGMYQVSGNLWLPLLAHVINNFMAILYYTRHKLVHDQVRSDK